MFHLDKLTEKHRIILAEQPDPLVTVKELEIKSYDGTLVPLCIIHRKDLKLNKNNVAFVRGYGAYGESLKEISPAACLLIC